MTTGGGYSYDQNAGRDAEERVAHAATNVEHSIQELADNVRALASSWEGNEQNDYLSVQSKVDNGHHAISQILTQVKTVLGENTSQVAGMQSTISNQLLGG